VIGSCDQLMKYKPLVAQTTWTATTAGLHTLVIIQL